MCAKYIYLLQMFTVLDDDVSGSEGDSTGRPLRGGKHATMRLTFSESRSTERGRSLMGWSLKMLPKPIP